MPDISGIPAIDVAIGLSFFYFLLSIVASSINEAIAVLFRLRARTLEQGIFSLLGDSRQVDEFFQHWRVGALIKPVSRTRDRDTKKERKPSYLPSRVFAMTVLDRFVLADHTAKTGAASTSELVDPADLLRRARQAVEDETRGLPAPVRGMLTDALNEAGNDAARFQRVVERSFDEVMDRASGWYKRRAQLILFLIALGLVAAINADSFAIGQRLWKDDALRSAVVAQAQKGLEAGDASACPAAADGGTSVSRAADCVSNVEQLDLPLGWQHWPDWPVIPGKLLGLLITAFALTLGAPFWFDLLGKITRIRGSGPPSPAAQEKNAELASETVVVRRGPDQKPPPDGDAGGWVDVK